MADAGLTGIDIADNTLSGANVVDGSISAADHMRDFLAQWANYRLIAEEFPRCG